MFLFFNKEYRLFESILSDLMAKAKKSTMFIKSHTTVSEVYELDTVDIYFVTKDSAIMVKDKSGKKIILLDCFLNKADELQNAKWRRFGSFLKDMREVYEEHVEKRNEKNKVIQKAQRMGREKNERINMVVRRQEKLIDALAKLRGL